MERPCSQYFNGVKYNKTLEYPLLAGFPERRFRKGGGLWTLNWTTTVGLLTIVAITPVTLEMGGQGASPSVPNPMVLLTLVRRWFAQSSYATRLERGEQESRKYFSLGANVPCTICSSA